MNCNEALPMMHEYLDGDLEGYEAAKLKEHLIACPACNAVFKQMEKAEVMVRMLPKPQTPDDMTSRIMNLIPMEKKRTGWLQWIRIHPAISVASVFLLVMLSSFISLYSEDQDMVVKGADLNQVVIRGNTVYIPEGQTVQGNLMVKKGNIQVDGNVDGNLVVIDGSYNLASTAHISGQVKQVDQILEWVWYKINDFFSVFAR